MVHPPGVDVSLQRSVPLLPFFEVPCEKWLVFLGFMESGSEGSTNSRLMQTLNSKRVTSAISKTAKVELQGVVPDDGTNDLPVCVPGKAATPPPYPAGAAATSPPYPAPSPVPGT